MIESSTLCTDVMKQDFNKELVITKKDNKDFKSSNECWIWDKVYVHCDVKVRDHCHITAKCRGSAHRDYNINNKLNHKIPIVFHNIKNHDSQLIMQEISKFNFKINAIPNELEKCLSFNINNKLIFIDSFQFLTSSLDSLVKNDFKCLTKKSDSNF